MARVLLSFGHGYTARALARRLLPQGWTILGTTRDADKLDTLRDEGITALLWPGDDIGAALDRASHILVSAAPGPDGDPVLAEMGDAIAAAAPRLAWAGYLSTTGVYGDHGGGWVDEDTPLTPTTARGRAGSRPSGSGNPSPACRCTSSGWRASTAPAAARSQRSNPAPRGASSSPARCSAAPMSRISRRCWRPRWRAPTPAPSTTSATTTRPRRRT